MADYDTEAGIRAVCARIHRAFAKHGRVSVTVRAGKRSLNQNAVQHVWYAQVALITGEHPEEVRHYCKLHFGVPILRAEDEEFRAFYDLAIRAHLTYPEKLKAMDFVPVTSRMTPPQMTWYLNTMREHYAREGIAQLEFLAEQVEAERDARIADERQETADER